MIFDGGRENELRTNDLASTKLTVARICNLDIDRNFYDVCEYIERLVSNSLPQSALLTAPSSEGAKNKTDLWYNYRSVFA